MSPVTGFGEEGFADKESAHVSKYRCFDQTADDQNMYFAEPIMGEHIHKQNFVWIDQLHAQFTYTFRHFSNSAAKLYLWQELTGVGRWMPPIFIPSNVLTKNCFRKQWYPYTLKEFPTPHRICTPASIIIAQWHFGNSKSNKGCYVSYKQNYVYPSKTECHVTPIIQSHILFKFEIQLQMGNRL